MEQRQACRSGGEEDEPNGAAEHDEQAGIGNGSPAKMGMHAQPDQEVSNDEGADTASQNTDDPRGEIRARHIKNRVTPREGEEEEHQQGAEDAEGSSRFHSREYKLVGDADEPQPMADPPTRPPNPRWGSTCGAPAPGVVQLAGQAVPRTRPGCLCVPRIIDGLGT